MDKLSRGATITKAEHERLTRFGKDEDDVAAVVTPAVPKKSENDLYWENLVANLHRPLQICDLDFEGASLVTNKRPKYLM